jgi:quinol monooxygenase YgiN
MQARSMCFIAKPGSGGDLADLLVQVSTGLGDVSGCVSWIVCRNPHATDEVWVQELWASAEAAELALAAGEIQDGPSPADVMALCTGPPRRTDLEAVGGVGFTG